MAAEIRGAGPNTPTEDVRRISGELARSNANVVVSFGGGSTIDATKAAMVLWVVGRIFPIARPVRQGRPRQRSRCSGSRLE